MSYEQDCNDYAVSGDPMRDHYDYEENARYDRFDGWGDTGICEEDPGCIDCHEVGECAACRLCREWSEKFAYIAREDQKRISVLEDDPNSPYYIPF